MKKINLHHHVFYLIFSLVLFVWSGSVFDVFPEVQSAELTPEEIAAEEEKKEEKQNY